MNAELLIAFTAFAFATSITPGPNNLMLLTSGVNHGFVRTLPHIIGITLGCVVMTVLVGFGLGGLLSVSPLLYAALRYAGAIYLVVLAWRVANSGILPSGASARRPMSVVQAAAFQWVNPKAWVMVMGAVTTYAPHVGFMRNVCVIALLLGMINAPSIAVWAGFGVVLRRVLSNPVRVRIFNIVMAALLLGSLYPVLRE